jgi:hypothetical protein
MEAFLTAQFLANFHAFVIIITPPQKSSRAGLWNVLGPLTEAILYTWAYATTFLMGCLS